MANIIAIQVEGVLRRKAGGAPIQQGLDLYYGLATRAKIVLLTQCRRNEFAGKELRSWLETEGLYEHVETQYHQGLYFEEDIIEQVRRINGKPSLVVVPNPEVAVDLVKDGYSTLVFVHAKYADPMHRPDADFEVRPWDSLAAQVAAEAFLKASHDKDAA